MQNQVRFKIGEIEFEAKGEADIIERERNVFMNTLLPAAVEAIQTTKNIVSESSITDNENEDMELLEIETSGSKEEIIFVNELDLERTSLASFIKKFGTLSDQDFVLIAAYFDEKKNEIVMFSSENVKGYYSEARRPDYSNISALLRELAKKGYIMDAPKAEQKTPKMYVLTREGLNYVETYQPKLENSSKNISNKPKKKKSKAESIYINVSADDMQLSKYPEIKGYKNFKDQMLMVMYIFAEEKLGESFSAQDIEYIISDILGIHVTNGQIQGIFSRNVQWFKTEPDPNNAKAVKHKLLEGGKDYARSLISGNI